MGSLSVLCLQLRFEAGNPIEQLPLSICLRKRCSIYGRRLLCHAYPVHCLLGGLLQICTAHITAFAKSSHCPDSLAQSYSSLLTAQPSVPQRPLIE